MIKTGNLLFNDNWLFSLRDIGGVDNGEWRPVEIPHDWLIGDTRNLYKTGEGHYKKTFSLEKSDLEKRLFLIFDGVYMNSSVEINGKSAFEWKYGYSSFDFEITDFVSEGENTIEVTVRYEAPNSRWYSGAGIFRSVWLRAAEKEYIANNGVYIYPRLENGEWFVNVETETIGSDEVKYTVLAPSGEAISTGSGKSAKIAVNSPKLWSTDSPMLYTLRTELFSGGKAIDVNYSKFGFRTIEFSPDNGFVLNGKTVKMRGVCMHHDLGALGAAVNYDALKRQMLIMKEMGVNAIRTSHNMPAKELLDICDEMGLLVDDEAFDMWELSKTEFDYARFFPEWYERDVASWVKRDRNHPCVIMWSIGNEIYDTHKSERGVEVAKMLKTTVLKHDPYENAKSTIGSCYMRWENGQKVTDYLKLAGYNYTEERYDEQHKMYPDWFIYGSETASTVRSRGIYHLPADTPILTHDDMQCSDIGNSVVGWGRHQESAWIMDRDRKYCGGQFIWTGMDYIGEPTPYSTKNSYFGIVDTAGFPKDAFYLYKAVWTDPKKSPFVHIFPHWDWNVGQEIDVFVYSNLYDTELFFNGKSLGKRHIDLEKDEVLHSAWKLKYKKGELCAKAYDENWKVVAEEKLSSFGEPTKIVMKPEKRNELFSDGKSMEFIEISVVDENGEAVRNARNRIKLTLNGAGSLVGLDNGDSTDYDSYKGNNRRLFSGKLLAMVRTALDSGEIIVRAESEGLAPAEISLTVKHKESVCGAAKPAAQYPIYIQPDTDEIPLRKIELISESGELNEKSKTAHVTARLLPENASYKDIIWKCVMDSGVVTNIAEVSGDNFGADVTAKGDGHFRLRAMCMNGSEVAPQIISELEFTVSGLGEAIKSPYSFISCSLYDFSNIKPNIVERGAISGILERTIIGFNSVDFGSFGSNILRLNIGSCSEEPVPIELWLGNPDNGGELIDTLQFDKNGCWDRFAPQDFVLKKRLTGIHSVAFVADRQCIFGGFEFVKLNKAFEKLMVTERDEMYGDDFEIREDMIANIGNNVLITFNEMDFGENGAQRLTICGRANKGGNTIQLRSTLSGGAQETQLIEFPHTDDYTEKTFDIKLKGSNSICFVFLPGSDFDFKWFRFE